MSNNQSDIGILITATQMYVNSSSRLPQPKHVQDKMLVMSSLMYICQIYLFFIAGSVWPPYPGANQGYWARQAGFYDNLPAFSRPKTSRTSSIISPSSSTQLPSIYPTNWTTQPSTPRAGLTNNSPFSLPTLFRPIQVLLGRRQVP